MKMNRIILKRIIYGVHISLEEPLCISNGDGEETDNDVLVNSKNEPFVPGSSLAGAIRNYLEQKKDETGMMGYLKKGFANTENGNKTESCMSSMIVSDISLFDKNNTEIILETRDQVKLENKIAVDGAKFDMQAVPTGTQGVFMCELVIREGDPEQEWEKKFMTAMAGINNGEIRLGTKKNRGYGSMKIVGFLEESYDSNTLDSWLDFDYKKYMETLKKCFDISLLSDLVLPRNYIEINVPLKLEGGISIRKYSAVPGEADFEQIRCNGVPVIPGTSWMGALRNRCDEFMKKLEFDDSRRTNYMNQWFGYVVQNKNKGNKEENARQSSVVIGESRLENSQELITTRNKIDRITNKTVDGALYTEKSYYGGDTVLQVKIKKTVKNAQALAGLLLLGIKDLQNGMLSVGGQTAVGRGVFSENGTLSVIDDDRLMSDLISQYYHALYLLSSEREEEK